MFDLARASAVIAALLGAVRARSLVGIAAALGFAYVLAVEMALGYAARASGALSPKLVLALVFFGPSALPRDVPSRLPFASVVSAHPLAVGLGAALLALVPWKILAGRASSLRPESPVARVYDAAALRFLFVGTLELMLVVLGALLAFLMRD